MKTQMAPILEAVKSQDKDEAYEWKSSDTWSTLEHLIANSSSRYDNFLNQSIKSMILIHIFIF